MDWLSEDPNPAMLFGFVLLLAGLLLLAVELKYFTHFVSGSLGALLFWWSMLILARDAHVVNPTVATAVGLGIAIITAFLAYLGMQARKGKHLTGQESMEGALGVARTDINPDGTVMIRGEYWRAHSDMSILAGKPVAVKDVKDLMLLVKEA